MRTFYLMAATLAIAVIAPFGQSARAHNWVSDGVGLKRHPIRFQK